jgi:SpoVK/Ycf46/Vps4 family AAA+-type ATPase
MGSLFLRPPVCSKTLLAKAIGNEGEIPTTAFDFGSLISETRFRR